MPTKYDSPSERRRDEQLRHVLAHDPVAVLIVDRAQGAIRYANPAARQLLRAQSDDLLGALFGTPIVAARPARIDLGLGRHRRHAEMRTVEIEWEGMLADLVTLRDLTPVRSLRRRVRSLRRRVVDDERFLAIVAHELRNPLGAMMSAAALLARHTDGSAVASDAVALLEGQVRSLARILDDLMGVARGSVRQLSVRREAVRVDDLVAHAVASAEPMITRQAQRLRVVMPEERLWLEVDSTWLSHALVHLLRNASDYSEPGQSITVEIRVEGPNFDEVALSVRDEGLGIEPEALPRLFELFRREPHARQRARDGLGIGLFMVRQIVKRHGGRVDVKSPGLGQGSTFTLRLPRMLEPPSPAEEIQEPDDDEAGKLALQVVVVDDEPAAAAALASLLTAWGHEAGTAENATQAIEMVRSSKQPIDVVILDLDLPDMKGVELARLLRTLEPARDAALVVLSGSAPTGLDAERGLFDRTFLKPIDFEALAQFLDDLDSSKT